MSAELPNTMRALTIRPHHEEEDEWEDVDEEEEKRQEQERKEQEERCLRLEILVDGKGPDTTYTPILLNASRYRKDYRIDHLRPLCTTALPPVLVLLRSQHERLNYHPARTSGRTGCPASEETDSSTAEHMKQFQNEILGLKCRLETLDEKLRGFFKREEEKPEQHRFVLHVSAMMQEIAHQRMMGRTSRAEFLEQLERAESSSSAEV
ncbi:MAG: hypothetical protein LQ350_005483 [Teloschistes chrysophthalmus]|nr:MAG: hypothetical protein LQ350_005483 [Niorma chrysophthalma]